MITYDTIGKSYTQTRKSDSRIVKALIQYLGIEPPAVLADIGAGTGNYTHAIAEYGFRLIAIEPSITMQSQALQHENINWRTGYAENLPLYDNEVDGVISTLALHHFSKLETALEEMARICKSGPIILFTCDPRFAQDFWLLDYFPNFYEESCKYFPSIEKLSNLLQQITSHTITLRPFLLPPDLEDQFLASIWKTPERVLDPIYRSGVSSFAMGDQDLIQIGLEKLKTDLKNGRWQTKYQSYMHLSEYDAGYRFVIAKGF